VQQLQSCSSRGRPGPSCTSFAFKSQHIPSFCLLTRPVAASYHRDRPGLVLDIPLHQKCASSKRTCRNASYQQSDVTPVSPVCGCLCCRYLRREYSALKPFVIISLSYLLFTTTDGAVRSVNTTAVTCNGNFESLDVESQGHGSLAHC
jgi:hypothetical protein